MSIKDIVIVRKEHIEAGIKKYQGKLDNDLMTLFENSGQTVKAYMFADGRVLLLYPLQANGILYVSKEVLFKKLDLS
jgi:hypothetical protein